MESKCADFEKAKTGIAEHLLIVFILGTPKTNTQNTFIGVKDYDNQTDLQYNNQIKK